jgi:hypothetical protein
MQKSIFSLLTEGSPVVIVANDKLEGSPIITPSVDDRGNAKTDLNDRPLGTLRLEQTARVLNGNFLNSRRKIAFLSGTLDELTAIVKAYGLKAGSELPGKIVTTESLEPMYRGQAQKINPSTGEIVEVEFAGNRYPVYQQSRYTENMQEHDALINKPEHVNAWISSRRAITTTAPTVETANMPQA